MRLAWRGSAWIIQLGLLGQAGNNSFRVVSVAWLVRAITHVLLAVTVFVKSNAQLIHHFSVGAQSYVGQTFTLFVTCRGVFKISLKEWRRV